MRTNVALFAAGAGLVLAGVALWSVPAALILAGLPCLALGLLRTETVRAATGRPAAGVQRHRRTGGRGVLRLVPPLVRRSA